MPWCPKCRSEYREGFESCSECGAALVEELPEEPAPEKTEGGDGDHAVFLVSAADNFEADIIKSKLEAYGVPVMQKHKEAGDYLHVYMGASPFGIDLYVPSKLLEKAREILEAVPEVAEDDGPALQEERELQEESEKRKDRSRNWLFLLFVVPVLIYILISLLSRK
jgi:hypothetical protein